MAAKQSPPASPPHVKKAPSAYDAWVGIFHLALKEAAADRGPRKIVITGSPIADSPLPGRAEEPHKDGNK
jgi:hypothetical protein